MSTAGLDADRARPADHRSLLGDRRRNRRRARQAGWRLVLAARSLDRLQALAEELGGPTRAIAVRCDVTEWEDQQRMVQEALDAFGGIDAAFANAGFGAPRGFLKDTLEHWREMVLTNVYGAALTIRATSPP